MLLNGLSCGRSITITSLRQSDKGKGAHKTTIGASCY